jgi:hypothetical protein
MSDVACSVASGFTELKRGDKLSIYHVSDKVSSATVLSVPVWSIGTGMGRHKCRAGGAGEPIGCQQTYNAAGSCRNRLDIYGFHSILNAVQSKSYLPNHLKPAHLKNYYQGEDTYLAVSVQPTTAHCYMHEWSGPLVGTLPKVSAGTTFLALEASPHVPAQTRVLYVPMSCLCRHGGVPQAGAHR